MVALHVSIAMERLLSPNLNKDIPLIISVMSAIRTAREMNTMTRISRLAPLAQRIANLAHLKTEVSLLSLHQEDIV